MPKNLSLNLRDHGEFHSISVATYLLIGEGNTSKTIVASLMTLILCWL